MVGPSDRQLRFSTAEVLALIKRSGAAFPQVDPIANERTFFFAPGVLYGPPVDAEICKGDSGGPVLLEDEAGFKAVGVNSLARRFSADDQRLVYAGFTRLDTASAHNIPEWIAAHGVRVVD